MNCSLRKAALSALSAVLAGMLAGCAPNAKEAKATVMYIDRDCKIVSTKYDEKFKPTDRDIRTDSCNSLAEWDKVRLNRNKVVDGTAVVHVSFTVPQTGQPGAGELKFDGRDDEFYDLKAGDDIDILVSDADPAKIQKA